MPCLDGIIGSFLAFLTINWVALKNQSMQRCILTIIMVFICIMNLLGGLAQTDGDIFTPLGGLLVGYFGSMPLIEILKNEVGRHLIQGWPYERVLKYVGGILTALFFVIGYTLFYVLRHPESC